MRSEQEIRSALAKYEEGLEREKAGKPAFEFSDGSGIAIPENWLRGKVNALRWVLEEEQ